MRRLIFYDYIDFFVIISISIFSLFKGGGAKQGGFQIKAHQGVIQYRNKTRLFPALELRERERERERESEAGMRINME